MELLKLTKNNKGQSLVEILIAMGLMTIFLPVMLTGFVASREAQPQKEKRYTATTLLREAEEAARSARESSWNNVKTAGTYYPQISGTEWALTSGTENTSDGFQRTITISDVNRDISGNIVTSGGHIDPSTKKLDISITWSEPIQGEVTSTMYLTRYNGNTTWSQDTQAEFTQGTNTNVSVVNNIDGEIELTPSTGGTWIAPTIVDTYNSPNNTDGVSVFSQGNYLYLGSDEFEIIDISNPLSVTQVGAITIPTVTAIYDIYVEGNYAYLATNGDEVVVIDVSNKASPTVADTLNLSQNNDGYGIFKSGNYAFLARDATPGANGEFYSINVTNPTNITLTQQIEIGSDVNGVYVLGNYAYIATDGNEMVVVNVTNPASMAIVGNYNTPTTFNGENIFAAGSYAYLVTSINGTGPELYIIDITNPASPSLTGSFEVGGNVKGVYVVGDYIFVASDKPAAEFQVINATNKSSPTLYGTTSINKVTFDVSVNGNYAYLAVADQTSELVIVEGGFGGGGFDYQLDGNYVSQTFDAGAEVTFNHIGVTANEPSGTDVKMQIATNNDNATWSFVGPDGTNATYFDNEGGIPLQYVLGRYFKFKAYLSGDGFDTPILEDVTVNYIP